MEAGVSAAPSAPSSRSRLQQRLISQARRTIDNNETVEEQVRRYSLSAGGLNVPYVPLTGYKFIGAPPTILLAGSTGGKTVMLTDVLYTIREHISSMLFFTNTATSTDSVNVASIVPQVCIRTDLNVPVLNEFFNRGKMDHDAYEAANDYDKLNALAARIAIERQSVCPHSQEFRRRMQQVDAIVSEGIARIENSDVRAQTEMGLRENFRSKLMSITRRYLTKIAGLPPVPGQVLTTFEQCQIAWCGKRAPCSVVVFDDFSSEIESALKDKKLGFSECMHRYFNNGRHHNIVTLMAIHAPNILSCQIRNLAGRYIMCTKTAVQALTKGGRNAIITDEYKRQLGAVADAVFTSFPPEDKRNYRKIVFSPTVLPGTEVPPISVTSATIRGTFEIGNHAFVHQMRVINECARRMADNLQQRERARRLAEEKIVRDISAAVEQIETRVRRIR
jgi:hypothetical protein